MDMVFGMLMWYMPVLGTSGSEGNNTLSGLLSSASDVLAWFITSMGELLSFVLQNPAILLMFLILISGSAVGMLFRVWHSA